jgi:hypothetical protein
LAPVATYFINENSQKMLFGYIFDNELIILNALITFIGLFVISKTTSENYYFQL